MKFTREQLLNRTKKLIIDIDQIFIDAEYWNNYVRKPIQAKINPDPQGELAKLKTSLHRCLKSEIRAT